MIYFIFVFIPALLITLLGYIFMFGYEKQWFIPILFISDIFIILEFKHKCKNSDSDNSIERIKLYVYDMALLSLILPGFTTMQLYLADLVRNIVLGINLFIEVEYNITYKKDLDFYILISTIFLVISVSLVYGTFLWVSLYMLSSIIIKSYLIGLYRTIYKPDISNEGISEILPHKIGMLFVTPIDIMIFIKEFLLVPNRPCYDLRVVKYNEYLN